MWRPRDGVPEAWAAREVLFYDTVAPATPAGPLLRCFDSGQSPQTKAWHLLQEDVTDSHRIATEWPLPPTEPQCRAIVGVLARFHAAWWDATQAEPDMPMVRDLYQRLPGFWANLSDRLGDCLSADRRRIYERFFAAPPHFARLATRKNLSIVHGDAHVWNVFLPNDDSAGGERLYDWSNWRHGLPANDLAFMMAMHWYPERRRRFERPLLDHYHAILLASGAKSYDRAALDHDYRVAVLTQLMTPLFRPASASRPRTGGTTSSASCSPSTTSAAASCCRPERSASRGHRFWPSLTEPLVVANVRNRCRSSQQSTLY